MHLALQELRPFEGQPVRDHRPVPQEGGEGRTERQLVKEGQDVEDDQGVGDDGPVPGGHVVVEWDHRMLQVAAAYSRPREPPTKFHWVE
ncbi:hypothetical protein D3C87_1584550 [compost metagenome]